MAVPNDEPSRQSLPLTTPGDRLVELALGGDDEQRRSVAAHPGAPIAALRHLAIDFPDEVGGNPALTLAVLENPSFFLDLPRQSVMSLAASPVAVGAWAEALFQNPDSHFELARNPATPVALLERIASALHPPTFAEALRRIDPTPPLLLRALTALDRGIRSVAARHPRAPADALALLRRAGASEHLERHAPTTMPLSHEERQGLLALGPWARVLLAGYPELPYNELEALATDPEDDVRLAVIQRGWLPEAIQLLLAEDDCEQNLLRLAALPGLTGAAFARLDGSGRTRVQSRLARRKDAPPTLLALYVQSEDEALAKNAAANAGMPPSQLRELAKDNRAHVRRGVAINQSTPPDCLEALANAGEFWALMNPEFPVDAMERWVKRPNLFACAALARNPSLPASLAVHLKGFR